MYIYIFICIWFCHVFCNIWKSVVFFATCFSKIHTIMHVYIYIHIHPRLCFFHQIDDNFYVLVKILVCYLWFFSLVWKVEFSICKIVTILSSSHCFRLTWFLKRFFAPIQATVCWQTRPNSYQDQELVTGHGGQWSYAFISIILAIWMIAWVACSTLKCSHMVLPWFTSHHVHDVYSLEKQHHIKIGI
jgi:hypothetical protein